ncbi:secretion-regulating guanine nucleotide exchange factor [Chanos chanos]|uniref:Secretion-regulating guanine nucleotide exchange factor n=1 Tax=Chanos chanos TaxID=29144 RepID=A0A6J2WP39_CHACN|nr:secretion-regulating guanine nucleotide exchange factor [Chanos chanos]
METTLLLKCKLYTWGANSYGQLGQGHSEDLSEPREAEGALQRDKVRYVTGGGGHTALITESGELLVCGQNHKGQLGLGHTSEVTNFQLCPLPSQRAIQHVCCGWDFSLILTDGGQVFACGSNAFGQLGISQTLKHSTEPTHIKSLTEPVISVAAGLRHSLAVSDAGGVYQWGTGLSSQAKRALSPQPVPPHLTSKEPCLIPGLEQVNPQRVAAGSAHCVCLTGEGEVIVWGSNKHGQLSNPEPFLPLPVALDRALLDGEKITNVHSGWTHLIAQTERGRVFTWGRANYGQLGRTVSANGSAEHASADSPSESSLACVPTEVKSLCGATKISCGSEHNLAIVGGRLLSWGWNEHGMCGDGSLCDVTEPRPIPALGETIPLLIGCGAGHSIALCCMKSSEET